MPKKSGFTLIELMVVITIIALLSTIAISSYAGTQKNARDARRRGDVDAISKAFESNYSAGTATPYPAPQTSWFTGNLMPMDPDGNNYYWNGVQSVAGTAAAGYVICARLENAIGNSSDQGVGDPSFSFTGVNGTGQYYCRRNQQ